MKEIQSFRIIKSNKNKKLQLYSSKLKIPCDAFLVRCIVLVRANAASMISRQDRVLMGSKYRDKQENSLIELILSHWHEVISSGTQTLVYKLASLRCFCLGFFECAQNDTIASPVYRIYVGCVDPSLTSFCSCLLLAGVVVLSVSVSISLFWQDMSHLRTEKMLRTTATQKL